MTPSRDPYISLFSRFEERTKILIGSAVATAFAIGAVYLIMTNPLEQWMKIAIIWGLLIPLSYHVLKDQAQEFPDSLRLPGVPVGSTWQQGAASKHEPPVNGEKARTEIVLSRLGYTIADADGMPVDILATSDSGKSVVVKICDDKAGILALQDVMKAMMKNRSKEAMLIAPGGSTSAARRFLHQMSSGKNVRITFWNSAHCLENQKIR